jgi:molecular chaperone IbpA
MRAYDFSPLFRHTVGFDRMARLLDTALEAQDMGSDAYPPYNIEQHGEDAYRISMAVAGFGEDDIEITQTENTLLVAGKRAEANEGVTYLHRGIAGRAFERRFQLADHIRVEGAQLVNGLLHIDLVREVPEEKQPRRIEVRTDGAKAIEQKAA